MKFENTGLKRDKVVEDAFNYAYAYNQSLAPEVMEQVKQNLQDSHQHNLKALDKALKDKKIDEAKYKAIKSQLERMLDLQMLQLPQLVKEQLNLSFSLAPALEMQRYGEKSSPALLAATLLLDCVRDPVDYKKIDTKFGSAISGLIAEILHIESYPFTQDANLAAASSDAKRVIMADLTSDLSQIVDQIAVLPPGAKMTFPPNQEETLFNKAKALWGNDKKLDTRLVDVFNRYAVAISSSYKIEVSAAGTPDLIQSTPPKTPTNPGPKNPPIIGDGGF